MQIWKKETKQTRAPRQRSFKTPKKGTRERSPNAGAENHSYTDYHKTLAIYVSSLKVVLQLPAGSLLPFLLVFPHKISISALPRHTSVANRLFVELCSVKVVHSFQYRFQFFVIFIHPSNAYVNELILFL